MSDNQIIDNSNQIPKTHLAGFEVNFDGLVGLTHHYAGLAYGNKASINNQFQVSNPKLAAKQGLLKMKALMDRGFKQAVLPPHQRPYIPGLRQLGFSGTEAQVLQKAAKEAPELLSMLSSASNMWVANAATISPSSDTFDGRMHITPANLQNKFHRSFEHVTTAAVLQAIFNNPKRFAHHPVLPHNPLFGDEGAANHGRLGSNYAEEGIELFVYGVDCHHLSNGPNRFPARQTLQASQAISRLHQLDSNKVVFAKQNPIAIDSGVFHNDVISVTNQNVLFYHEFAFEHHDNVIAELSAKLDQIGVEFRPIMVPNESVTLEECVDSYLFNSQLLTKPDGRMMLVLPKEAQNNTRVWRYIENLLQSNTPIDEVMVFDLRESMKNGGGPACLRLRVAMSQAEFTSINQGIILTDELYEKLDKWIDAHYRDKLVIEDLGDPMLLQENYRALDELTVILNLNSIYDFQKNDY
ncbi:N-succinylarginine dihydrolase [Thorsellia anophelis]|uniref:N-succinylarginine dihydrolase n=1 Tax=Thorsellia anophelis DSM 18579 TaxID=1123402 RepID=A0A1I0BZA0_9GAMM|nr:N-succinylarginine dihydrolase [Thorsellia anophelis]SET12376.1 succinylarginine dihydrolase [Thorsellia anophelis DSM 18579]